MNATYPRKGLFDTEARTLFCARVGRAYQLSVSLPDGYATSGQAYPVIYLLDGDLFFGMAAGLTQLSHWCVGTPEVIVVGIGYDIDRYDQWDRLREMDFTVTAFNDHYARAEPDAEGIADRFLEALTQEIIPFIDENYRTDPSDRCLYGYSWGGFFVLYALFHQPDAFQRYISGSGCLEIANPYLMAHAEQLVARISDNLIQLYLSVGALEEYTVPAFHQLISFIETRNYPDLNLTTEIYPGEPHGSEGVALTYLHGIRRVYQAVRATE